MTRINIIPVEELTDQHLIAEYREIFMVGSALQRSLKSPNWDFKNIPKKFNLGSGHVMFFYDKGKYLYKRYCELRTEMRKRRFNPDSKREYKLDQWPDSLFNDWIPTKEDQKIIRQRLEEKIKSYQLHQSLRYYFITF